MNSIVIYPETARQVSVLEALLEEMKIRFSVKKTKKADDSLFTKETYFAMLDESIKSAEQGNVYQMKEGQSVKDFLEELCTN